MKQGGQAHKNAYPSFLLSLYKIITGFYLLFTQEQYQLFSLFISIVLYFFS